jgi:hypothetical protein
MARPRTQVARRVGPAALEAYLRRMREIRATGSATAETSYYPALEVLLNAVGATLDPKVHVIQQVASTGAGSPDFAFHERVSGALRGVVEAKPTSDDALRTASGDQVVRYHRRYGLVLVTNYRDFLLVAKNGRGRLRVESRYSVADSEQAFWSEPARRIANAHGERFFDFVADVLTRAAPILRASDLADSLARYAREALFRIQAHDVEVLAPLRAAMTQALGLHFREQEGEDFFRSSLVQTLFYGLFSAWILWGREERSQEARFDWRTASDHLQLPLVDSLFEEIARPSRLRDLNLREPLEWAEAALNRVAREEFFKTFEEEQAIQYFYEPFVEAFDPTLRDSLGVWYTPPEIVRYQVARVDTLLREELGIPDGLADPRVVVLDPVVGTGSYLVEALKTIHSHLVEKGKGSVAALELKKAATQRVFGFEILPAPFVVAHLQLGLLLRNIGASLAPGERLGVYLTNSLSGWEPPDPTKETISMPFPELAKEQEAAEHVKRDEPILVILGNPPYNRFSGTALDEEADLIAPYAEGLRHRFGVRTRLLNDLYIRFLRLAERQIAEVRQQGIVSLITNYSWLQGLSHPVMREHLLRTFDSIWVDNLGGEQRAAAAQDGSVFTTATSPGIRVGVAITHLVKGKGAGDVATVRYRELHGSGAVKRAKLEEWVSTGRFDPAYQLVTPEERRRWAIPPARSAACYWDWTSVGDLFPVRFSGFNANRDATVTDTDLERLRARMRVFLDSSRTDTDLSREWGRILVDNADATWSQARTLLLGEGVEFDDALIRRLDFRPFDTRWVYYEKRGPLLHRPSPDFSEQVFYGNLFLAATQREERRTNFDRVTLARNIGDLHLIRPDARFIPLFVRQTVLGVSRDEPNIAARTLSAFCAKWGVALRSEGELTDQARAIAEELFYHAVAILQSPAYRAENAGDLRQNWPRLPIPQERELLAASAALGRQVADLLQSEVPVPRVTTGAVKPEFACLGVPRRIDNKPFCEADLAVTIRYSGTGRWERRAYREGETPDARALTPLGNSTGDLWWNDVGCWANVPEAVWGFTIGGYPVLKKWLTYRHESALRRPLSLEEVNHLTAVIRRVAAVLLLGPALDHNFRQAVAR